MSFCPQPCSWAASGPRRSQGQGVPAVRSGRRRHISALCISPVSLLGEHGRDPSGSLATGDGTRFVAGPPQVMTAVIPPESPDSRHSAGYANGDPQQAAAVAASRRILSPHCRSNPVIPSESPRWAFLTRPPSVAAAPGALRFRLASQRVFQVLPPGTGIVGNGGAP